MPLQPARRAKDTVSYRPNAHRTENVTVLATAPPSPSGLEAVPGAAGTLNNATYTYRVTAVRNGTESGPSVLAQATTTAGIGAGSVALTWNEIPDADSYNVYGRTGTIQLIDNVAVASFTDDGSLTPAGALPTEVGLSTLRLPHRDNVTDAVAGADVSEYRNRYGRAGI